MACLLCSINGNIFDMDKQNKTYKWGNYEIELGKVYTLKDFPPFGPPPKEKSQEKKEE